MTVQNRTCSIDGCVSVVHSRGWCKKHYERWRVHGDPFQCGKMSTGDTCSVDSCSEPILARDWCRKHYSRWYKTGSLECSTISTDGGCLIGGCGRPVQARGLCITHYNRRRLGMDRGICSIDGCQAPVVNQLRGWCNKHYSRFRQHGNPLATAWSKSPDMAPTSLYRLWDDRGRLLYVGITKDVNRRFREHGKFSAWWPEVAWHGVQTLPTRIEASVAERLAIQTELPIYNQKHMPTM